MKTNFGWSIGSLLTARATCSRSAKADQSFVVGDDSKSELLRQTFRKQLPPLGVLSTGPGNLQVLRRDRTGAFDTAAFRRVMQTSPGIQPVPTGALTGSQTAAQQPAQPGVQSGSPAVTPPVTAPTTAERTLARLENLSSRLTAVGGDVTEWLDTPDRDRAGSDRAVRRSIVRRDEANQEAGKIAAELHACKTDILADRALPPPAVASAVQQVDALRRQVMSHALLLALPGLQRLSPDEMRQLVDSMLGLDTLLREAAPAGTAPYRLDKVITLLASHGAIQQFASSPVLSRIQAAADGLGAMAETITRAATPPCDGSALDSLLGMDCELDALLKQVRIKATTDLLLSSQALRNRCTVDDLPAQDRTTFHQEATQIVEADAALAKMRQQVRRGLERTGQEAGPGLLRKLTGSQDSISVIGLSGVKFDAALITGLRAKFGNDAKKIGIVVAGLALAEQRVAESRGAESVIKAIDRQLLDLHRRRAAIAANLPPMLAPPLAMDEVRGRYQRMIGDIDSEMNVLVDRARGPNRDPNDQARQAVLVQDKATLTAQIVAIDTALEDRRQATAPLRVIDDQINLLQARQRALRSDAANSTAELVKAGDAVNQLNHRRQEQVDNLTMEQLLAEGAAAARDMAAALAEPDAVPPPNTAPQSANALIANAKTEIDQLDEKLIMANKALGHWQTRASAPMSRDLTLARQEVDTASARLTRSTADLERQQRALNLCEKQIAAAGADPGRRLPRARADLDAAAGVVRIDQRELDLKRDALHKIEQQFAAPAGQYKDGALVGGLTADELKAMGLSDSETHEAMQVVAGLARQGLQSAEQVEALLHDVNAVMGAFNSSFSHTHGSIADHHAALAGGKNEDRAKHFGDQLVRDLTHGQDDAGTEAARMTAALARLAPPPQGANDVLLGLGQQYAAKERNLLWTTDGLNSLDTEREAARSRIKPFGEGRDPDHPVGLALSKKLIEAWELLQRCGGTMANAAPAQKARFATLLADLKGQNLATLKPLPWSFRHPDLAEQDIRNAMANQGTWQAAQDIVFLRETEPMTRQALKQKIALDVSDMDRLLDARAAQMGDHWPVLRDAVRAAILRQFAATPGATVEKFSPADHAGAIRARLQSWGVDTKRFAPEINMLLSESFGPQELSLWSETTNYRKLAEVQTARVADVAQKAESGRTGIGAEAKAALLDGVDRMTNGTKLKLTTGHRVEVQTGNIPLEPTNIATINVKVAGGKLDGIEIERGSDGYQLVLRDGFDAKAGGEVSVAAPFGSAVGLKLQGTAGIEAAGYRVSGAAFRFPNTDSGKAALKSLLENLLSKGRIEVRDLAAADDIMPLVESRLGGKASVGVKFGFDPFGASEILPDLKNHNATARARAKAGVSAATNRVAYRAGNTNLTVDKTERTVTVDLSASLALNMKVTTAVTSPSTDLLAGDVTANLYHYKTKGKVILGPDGLVKAGTEIVRQSFAPSAEHREDVVMDRLGGATFRRLLADLTAAERAEMRKIIALASPEDMISITFSLDERVRTAANVWLEQAKALRAGRTAATGADDAIRRAEALEAAAQALLDDDDNYIPAKLQLIPTIETQRNLLGMNLMFVKWETYNEDKSEWVAAEMRFDAAKAQSAADRTGAAASGARKAAAGNAAAAGPDPLSAIRAELQKALRDTAPVAPIVPRAVLGGDGDDTARNSDALSKVDPPKGEPARETPPPARTATLEPAMSTQSTGASTVLSGHAPVTPSVAERVRTAVMQAEELLAALSKPGVLVDRVTLRKVLHDLAKLISAAGDDPLVAQEGKLAQLRLAADKLHRLLLSASPMERLSAGELARRTTQSASKVDSGTMYVEPQEVSACGVHAINAFLGGQVMTRGQFDDWITDLSAGIAVEELRGVQALQSSAYGVESSIIRDMLEKLSDMQDSSRARVGRWTVSVPQGADRIADVKLPEVLDRTDRAVIGISTDFGEHSQSSDHYVAFRKDDKDRWWLLDSRNSEIGAVSDPPSLPAPHKVQISPQDWLNSLTRSANVRAVVVMAPGIGG